MYDKSDWIKAILATSVVFLSLLALLLMVDMTVAVDASAKEEAVAARPSSSPYTALARPTPENKNSGERHTASSRFSKKFEGGGPLLEELSAVYMRSAVGQPWRRSANEDRMDDLFGKGQWQNLEYENVEPGSVFSSTTDFVFLEGSQFTTEEMDRFVNDNMNLMNNWVTQGGCLLINAAPDEGNGVNFDQFGVTLSLPQSNSNNGTAADQGHPIFKEPYTPTETAFEAYPLSTAFFSGRGLSPIISDTANQIVLGEQKSGFGRVVFGGLTLPWFDEWDPQPQYTNLHKNIIHYAATCFESVMSGVELAGPQIGGIKTDYTFTATIIPTYTRGAITYTWEATGQEPQIHANRGPTDTVTWNWNSSGSKEITVTGSSRAGEVFANHTIEIETVVNAPPEARNVMINPSEVMSYGLSVVPSQTDFTVSYTYHDDENDAEAETRIVWTRDDQITLQKQPKLNNETTVTGSLAIAQERWCATVTPHDGNSYGEPVNVCAYIGTLPDNLLPQARNVAIPPHPSDEDALTVEYDYRDGEGDSEDQGETQLRWYSDDTLQPAFNDKEEVPAGETNIGEVWCAKVRVNDGTDFGLPVDSNCGIISPPGNTLPVISNPRIRPDMPKDSDDLSVSYGYIDPDGDPEDQTQTVIRWLRDGQLQPEFNNQRSVSAMFTTPGEKWWAVIQPHDGQHYGRFDITRPVYISQDQKNTPPEVINVQIRPAEPSPEQDLRLTYEYSDPDEGDVEENTIIRWYQLSPSLQQPEHMAKYDNLTVVPAEDTAPSDVWYAVVIPYDGEDYGPDVPAHSVTIRVGEANSPPQALEVRLAPPKPGVDQNLKLSYEYDDRNGDEEGATEIKWTINGREEPAILFLNRPTIPARVTSVGQEWCATVTPHDGTKPGQPVQSNCVTIAKQGQNTAPTISEQHIDPPVPRSSDDLNLNYIYSDPDNHPEANTTIRWYRDLKPFKSNYEDQTVIPASQTSPGEKWSAVIQVLDANGESSFMTSTELVIINTPPEVVSAAIVPQEPVTTESLTVSYQYSDRDNHPASDPRIIRWFKNGAHQKEYDGQKTVPADATSIGDKWVAQLRPFDGHEDGSKFITDPTYIRARLYLPIIIRQMPSPPDEPDKPTPTPSPTNTPTPTPSPTPTPAPFEPNNTSEDAYGPLVFGQLYEAYPEDQDDWYYITFSETTSIQVIVDNYAPSRDGAGGQVIVYEPFFNPETGKMDRRVIANDGREVPNMKIPNELAPNALKDLPPRKYLIRIYTVANHSREELYQLQSNKRQ